MKNILLATALTAAGLCSLSSSYAADRDDDQSETTKPSLDELRYTVELDYDSESGNLLISYRTLALTSSICFYETSDLLVSDATPTFAGSLPVGLISFSTAQAEDGICLTAIGHSSGNITVEAFSGVPSALVIDGVSYGFLKLSEDGQSVELVKELD